MPNFGRKSRENLNTAHLDLRAVFIDVVEVYDCKILCGIRTAEEQQWLYASGRTRPGPILTNKDGVRKRSRHQGDGVVLLSLAVDVAPYPVNWGDTNRFYHFAGYVKGRAQALGIPIRWGGDWDSDTDLSDQSFYDLPHFELIVV